MDRYEAQPVRGPSGAEVRLAQVCVAGLFRRRDHRDLTTELSRIRDSFVIARNTAFTYKGKSTDAKEIGKELRARRLGAARPKPGAGHLLESGGRIRAGGQVERGEGRLG
jgi:hypothetical protein